MRRRLLQVRTTATLLISTLALVGATALPAHADVRQTGVVATNPVDWTPHVLNGTVRAIAVVGETVVVGGDFTQVEAANRHSAARQSYLFAYHRRTGVLLPFAPRLDGAVNALAAGPGNTVYVGGEFHHANGEARRSLVLLRLPTGNLVTGFEGWAGDGDVRGLAAHGGWLYVGGTFTGIGGADRTALARLDARTGAVDPTFDLALDAPQLSRAKVQDLALSPDGRSLVVVGAITQVAGRVRAQIAMINTGVRPAALSPWFTNVYAGACRAGFDTYLRGVDFGPDGSYFVVVTTGRLAGQHRMCDTAARFETAGYGAHLPTWINHTGGDSLYAVSVAGVAVYVGGHQRWMNNPYGNESAGPGAVARPGIAALDPRTGQALSWNPTRSRGVGVQALVAVPEGLLVGSDTDKLGREYHGRLGMFPLNHP